VETKILILKIFSNRIEDDNRTFEDIKNHYEIEVQLARKLRNANTKERRHLYTNVYNELFSRVPLHPQLVEKTSPDVRLRRVASELTLIKRFISRDTIFLEVGAGDCALSKKVAKVAQHVFAIDVSPQIVQGVSVPNNVKFELSDGTSIPVKYGSIDVVYSNQLMEHLHPSDALKQVKNIFRSLRKGGKYICITPNKINGPHDVSKFFDMKPKGFHLKEYTNKELINLFKEAGFRKFYTYFYIRDKLFRCPISIVSFIEVILSFFRYQVRVFVASLLPFRELLGIKMIAIK
jgi:SAM-dependent methyltransferase|tara:strand:+ start:1712 stop:2584 length:873 start_codon:yes stop_codon:yes gene_type:complete